MDSNKTEDLNRFKKAVKLIATFQLVLEQMDELKGTKLYKHQIKNQINNLERSIEKHVFGPVRGLDDTNEELFTHIQNNIELVLDMTTEELGQLRVIVEDERDA
jgi:hypothetical protein